MPLKLINKYDSLTYPKLLNYEAINVNTLKEIPRDYYGYMAVPITILLCINWEQFEVFNLVKPMISVDGKYTEIFKRVIVKRRV